MKLPGSLFRRTFCLYRKNERNMPITTNPNNFLSLATTSHILIFFPEVFGKSTNQTRQRDQSQRSNIYRLVSYPIQETLRINTNLLTVKNTTWRLKLRKIATPVAVRESLQRLYTSIDQKKKEKRKRKSKNLLITS